MVMGDGYDPGPPAWLEEEAKAKDVMKVISAAGLHGSATDIYKALTDEEKTMLAGQKKEWAVFKSEFSPKLLAEFGAMVAFTRFVGCGGPQ